jgi:CDP-diacylglycerol--glycerol-3-phosphate 3-phosphatidyltransferase
MVSIYRLKPGFQNILRPLLCFLRKKAVTPNMLTITAFIGSALAGGSILFARFNRNWLFVIPIWLFVRMALNALDGMMAREFDMMTDAGAVLNEVGDLLSDLTLYLPLTFLEPSSWLPVVLFCLGALMTEFCGILGQALGVSRHYEGPLGKSDRAVLVGGICFITALLRNIFAAWSWIFSGAALLSVWTCGMRVRGALRECRQQNVGHVHCFDHFCEHGSHYLTFFL